MPAGLTTSRAAAKIKAHKKRKHSNPQQKDKQNKLSCFRSADQEGALQVSFTDVREQQGL